MLADYTALLNIGCFNRARRMSRGSAEGLVSERMCTRACSRWRRRVATTATALATLIVWVPNKSNGSLGFIYLESILDKLIIPGSIERGFYTGKVACVAGISWTWLCVVYVRFGWSMTERSWRQQKKRHHGAPRPILCSFFIPSLAHFLRQPDVWDTGRGWWMGVEVAHMQNSEASRCFYKHY